MPVESVNASSLLTLVDPSAGGFDVANADQFLSFLNTSSNQLSLNNFQFSNFPSMNNSLVDNQQPENNNQDNEDSQTSSPQAVYVATPVQPVISNPPPAQEANSNVPQNNQNNNDTRPAQNNNQNVSSQASNPSSNNNQQNTNSTSSNQADNSSTTTSSDATSNGSNSKTLSPASEKKLREGLEEQLSNIGQIIAAMMQNLSNPQAANTTTVTTTTSVTATDKGSASGSGQVIVAESATVTATTGSDKAPFLPGLFGALYGSIMGLDQSALQQDKQALGSGSGSSQDLSKIIADTLKNGSDALNIASVAVGFSQSEIGQSATGSNLQALANLLQQSLDKLSQLLPQSSGGASNNAGAQTATNAQPAQPQLDPAALTGLSLSDLGSQLKDTITQARAQLQKLQTVNEVTYSQAKAQFVAAIQQFSTTQGATTTSKDASVPVQTIAVATTTASASPNVSLTPPIITDLQFMPVAVTANGLQAAMDNSGNNNSGTNDNNQNPAPAVAPASTGQPQTTPNASAPSFAKVLGQISQGSVLDQVSFQVKTAVSDGSSKIHIQLSPADLGKLEIKVSIDSDGKTGVTITADNKNTLDLLQRDSQGLARALSDAGLSADSGSMNFNLGGGQQQDNGQPTAQAAMTYQKSQPEEDNDPSMNVTTRSYVVNLAEGLDIRI